MERHMESILRTTITHQCAMWKEIELYGIYLVYEQI